MSAVLSDCVLTPVSNAASATAGYVCGAAGKVRDAVTSLFSSKVVPLSTEAGTGPQSTKFNWKGALKFTFAILVITGLIVATVFSGGAVGALAAAGVAAWKVGLAGVGVGLLGGSAIGAFYFAVKHDMDRDTGHNLKDAAKFLGSTIAAPLYVGMHVLNFAKDCFVWSLFFGALLS
jgi:hypothetical protein